jgi:hypothetical protein
MKYSPSTSIWLCAVLTAGIVLADIWFGGHKEGLQGIYTVPRYEFTLYSGMTSAQIRVMAVDSDTGISDVSDSSTFSVFSQSQNAYDWLETERRLMTTISGDDTSSVHRGYIRAIYQGYTQNVYFALYDTNYLLDADGDWMEDGWEAQYWDRGMRTNITGDAHDDWDRDGTNNLFAFVLGIDPGLTNCPAFDSGSYADNDWDGIPDGWETDKGGTNNFSRLGDYDGDGLTDYEEYVLGTDPTDADMDDDDVNDYWDIVVNGPNPVPTITVEYPAPGSII